MQKDLYLVVVSILEGRNFPNRSKFQLMVECRFDGELLSTDPVEHACSPNFTTELAWELDKKSLYQHRMQRTPIKLQCYAVSPSNGVLEQVGYVLLDLRLAQQRAQSAKWYKLLNSKYSRMKPAIKIGMSLEDDEPSRDEAFKAKDAPPRTEKLSYARSDQGLVALLNKEEGYFQIGDSNHCKDMFVLSVTVRYAVNLEQLIPSDKVLPQANPEFFFYYSLLGNEVTNDPFCNLVEPEFLPERASVRLRSSPAALHSYFSKYSGNLQISICYNDHSFGNAEIPLSDLFREYGSENVANFKPVFVEDAFILCPTSGIIQGGGVSAKVGVSICLKQEKFRSESAESKYETDDACIRNKNLMGLPESPVKGSLGKKELIYEDDDFPYETMGSGVGYEHKVEVRPGKIAHFSDSVRHVMNLDKEEKATKQTHGPAPEAVAISDISTTTSTHPAVPPQASHFRFSLQFKTIMNVDLPFVCNAFLKYSYPFFGSASPIMTHPPVEIPKKIETVLPQSLCTFDFACSLAVLQNTFYRAPLIVELWHADKESGATIVGTTAVPLQNLLLEDPTPFTCNDRMAESGQKCSRWSSSIDLSLASVSSSNSRIADLKVTMALEDYGPVHNRAILMKQQQKSSEMDGKNSHTIDAQNKSVEYDAAVELELWKEQQEQHFEKQLRNKEVARMRDLAKEWQRRDKERESLLTKTLAEYSQLEVKLRKSLADIEAREKHVCASEQQLVKLQSDIHHAREQALEQTKESTARMKEDCVRQVQMERSRITDLEEDNAKLKLQVSEAEAKYAAFKQKFEAFKLQQNNLPEARAQSEVKLLALEKSELERKLDTVTKSKLHYKQQWSRALKELARLKQKEQEYAMATLQRQQEELKRMRSCYVVGGEHNANSHARKELLEMKLELDRIKNEQIAGDKSCDKSIAVGGFVNSKKRVPVDSLLQPCDASEKYAARLNEERDTLLRTGVYCEQDRIILELDKRIRSAITGKPAR